MTEHIGLIGIGRMGREIGPHLAAAGYQVVAHDANPEALAQANGWAVCVDSPAAVAAAVDVVIILVATDDQVLSCVCGPDGVLQGARPGLLVAVSATVLPATVRAVAEQADGRDIAVVDAPLIRGEAAARARNLLVYFGGENAAVARARKVFSAFSSEQVHLGELGAGQVGKMANNALLWVSVVANREVEALARAYGLDVDAFRQALLLGSGSNWALAHPENLRSIPWAAKDMEGLQMEARSLGLQMPVCRAVREEVEKLPGVVPLSALV